MEGWYRKGFRAHRGEPLARQLASCTRDWACLIAVHRSCNLESMRHTSTEDMTSGDSRVRSLTLL